MSDVKFDREFWAWVDEHLGDDVTRLRLQWRDKMAWADDAITHIECMQRARGKLFAPGHEGEWSRFVMLLPLSVEQCTSPQVAQLHCRLLEGCQTVLDMTCGMGIDTLHFARAGHTVTTVEINHRIALAARHNFAGIPGVTVVEGDSVEYLRQASGCWDAIFIDPARRGAEGQRVFGMHDCQPDVIDLLPLMRQRARRLVVKLSPMLDVTQTLRDLPGITALWVVGDGGECKEVLAAVDLASTAHDTAQVPIVIAGTDGALFTFTQAEETAAPITWRLPQSGDWLLEPSAAAMKAAPFRTLAARLGIAGIAPNTHLYLAEGQVDGFPGRQHKIVEVVPFTGKAAKAVAKRYPQADVAARNFPMRAHELQRRLRIASGGDLRIVAVTACDNKRYLLVVQK